MGHAVREFLPRCDVLDEIEAAVTLRRPIHVWLKDDSVRSGLPVDLVTHDHEDYLYLANSKPIAVTSIKRVERD